MTRGETGWANGAAGEHPRRASAARLLLILTAVLALYFGLSSLLLPFVGEPNLYSGIARWTGPVTGGLQLVTAAVAFRFAIRRNLPGAILAVAACLFLGWIDLLPPIIRDGFDLRAEAQITAASVVALPVVVFLALVWRHTRPILAAFIVTAPTTFGLSISTALAISVAMHGF